MLKFNAVAIGIGDKGISAVNRIALSDMPEIRTAVFYPYDSLSTDADYVLKSKYDFTERSNVFFNTPDTVVFIIADCSDQLEISLACELAFLTTRMGGFAVALAHMPSSYSPNFASAREALEELHDCFDSVVRFNESYCDDFRQDVAQFFGVLSRAMSADAVSGLRDFCGFKSLFERQDDIYFAYVSSRESYDSLHYRADCLTLKLNSQTHVDIANFLHFFYSSNGPADSRIIDSYTAPIKKINIAFMNTINTYITENCPELDKDEYVFAVICAK